MHYDNYLRIKYALESLNQTFLDQPHLDQLSAESGLSPHHFHKTFVRYTGLTPKKILEKLTLEFCKERLRESQSLLDTALEAGLSGPSRLHDLFLTWEAMTPGTFKTYAQSAHMFYGFHPSPFGEVLLLATEKGITGLHFVESQDHKTLLENLRQDYKEATLEEAPHITGPLVESAFAKRPVHLIIHGSTFQIKVWEALMRIPGGSVTTYTEISKAIGKETAVRAVASAIGANSLAYLIPCHRVIRSNGALSGYRWGEEKKLELLLRENVN